MRPPESVKSMTTARTQRSRSVELLLVLACGCCVLAASPGSSQRTTEKWDHESSFLSQFPKPAWGPDPFLRRPGHAPLAETEPTYELSAVLHDGADSQAIINDQLVRMGDEIGWRTVEEIGPNYVLLSDAQDSVIELTLPVAREPAGSIELEEIGEKR